MVAVFSVRGLFYIVTAILIGTLFVAAAYFLDAAESWGREGRWVPGFVQTYVLALAGGFAAQAAFAVLLLWLTRAARPAGPARWIGFGTVLGVVVPWAFARAGYLVEGLRFSAELQPVKFVLRFPLMGAMMYETQPLWVLAAVGAATGGTLFLVMGVLSGRQRR